MTPSTTCRARSSSLLMRASVCGSARWRDVAITRFYSLLAGRVGRFGRGGKETLHDLVCGNPLRLRIEVGQDTMAQHRHGHSHDIIGRGIVAAIEGGAGFCAQDQI